MEYNILYKKSTARWTSYLRGRSTTCSNHIYILNRHTTVPPTGLSFATVNVISNCIVKFEGYDYTNTATIPPSLAINCNNFWVLYNINTKSIYNDVWVVHGLLRGTLRVVCDGFYKPQLNSKGITTS